MSSDSNWVIDPEQDSVTPRVTKSGDGDFYTEHTTALEDNNAPSSGRKTRNTRQDQSYQRTDQHESPSFDYTGDERPVLGELSDAWKSAVSCLALGSIVFLATVLVLFAFSLTASVGLLYVIGVLTLLYGAFRLGFSYYIYRDAKTISYHSQNNHSFSFSGSSGWEPRPMFWGVTTFMMPPFIEYAPAVVYFVRRHQNTGVP